MASPQDGRVRGGAAVEVTTSAVSSATTGRALRVPLTERILSRLPGPRVAWVVAWALVPWLNLAVILASDAAGWIRAGILLIELVNRVAVSLAILLSLWGAARITDQLLALGPALAKVVQQDGPDVERLFRGLDSALGPLLLTAATAIVLPLDEAFAGEPLAALIQGVTWLLLGIPLWTVVWVYLALQIGLNRLGRRHLSLEIYRGDRSLGLRPVGILAFTGFWMLFGSVGPLVLTNLTDLPGVLVGIAVLLIGVGLFFLSLRGMNRQMVATKQRELALALDLYMQAYRPIRDQPSLEMLQRQAGLLKAAEDLEKRAERIQQWPFDEPTFARVVTIASSVTAAIIARLILGPIGL
jgi:hypothetical protein